MSLRAKLTGAMVALAVVSVMIVGVWTVVGTTDRLRDEVSDSLDRASVDLIDRLARPGGPGGPPLDGEFPGGPGASGAGRTRDLERILYQLLGADGTVLRRGADQALPVSERDRAVAAALEPGTSTRREIELDGEPFELHTTAVGGGSGALQVARSLEESERIVGATLTGTAVALVVVAALAGLAGWLLARSLTRPLVSLTETAETVARTGDLDVALPADRGDATRDESRRLTRAFRTMLASLATSRAAQQRLVQDAGHELRTPLTSLRTNVALLRRADELDPEARRAVLDDLDAETRELTDLVNEIVVLAGSEVENESISTVDLALVCEEVVQRARRRSGRDVVVVLDDPCSIAGRRGAIVRAVRNLVDNALKFDQSAGPIEVRVAGSTIEVADRGPGVAPGELDRIFERFHRTDEARSRPGSGLGLAIVAAVAADHHGSCRAVRREGGGLIVSITFSSDGPSVTA